VSIRQQRYGSMRRDAVLVRIPLVLPTHRTSLVASHHTSVESPLARTIITPAPLHGYRASLPSSPTVSLPLRTVEAHTRAHRIHVAKNGVSNIALVWGERAQLTWMG